MSDALTLIVPGDPGQRTGGYLYDRHIVEALRQEAWTVKVLGLAGQFPLADKAAAEAMSAALAEQPDGARVVIDGLALGGVPDVVGAHAERLDLTALVHHPLADETGLDPQVRQALLESERRALAWCRRIIVTSPFTARRLRELGLSACAARVVEPGVAAAELAPAARARIGAGPEPVEEHLLCVASLTPRKGQDVLLNALSSLAPGGWRCRLSGSAERDRAFAARITAQIKNARLGDRVELPGERNEAELADDYAWATVCVLPSHYEGYGMVISEALARGLPVISTTGGALGDTLPDGAGLKVAPNDVEQLQAAIARWMSDPSLRRELTAAAVRVREQLPGWADSARRFAMALEQI